MCVHAETALPCSPASVPAARSWLTDHLRRIYGRLDATADDAVLVVSELVTNCLNARAHEFAVIVEAHHDRLTVAATDDAPGTPVPRTAAAFDPGGRGLAIVDALSTAWGVHPGPDTKTVWAELPIPAHADPRFSCPLSRQ